MGGDGGGQFVLERLSRPLLRVRVSVGDQVVSVFNAHLKSKLGELITPEGADYPPAADLTRYDPLERDLGSARAALRRMAEAWVLRREIVREIEAGYPVLAVGILTMANMRSVPRSSAARFPSRTMPGCCDTTHPRPVTAILMRRTCRSETR